jgi:hypothetical protein
LHNLQETGDGILWFVADVRQAGGGVLLFVVDVITAESAPLMEQRSSAPNSCLRKIFFQPQPQWTLAPEASIIQCYLSRLILANAR